MGLDYGSKTIGVAISDSLGWTAQGIETISRQDPGNLIESIKRLKALIDEYEVELIVVGLPKHMNNDLGERVDRTLYFVRRLERELEIRVETFDERLSTVAAERVLTEGKVRKEDHKKYIDKIAASLILQTYLDLKRT
jgi:putative Holliday junction resolvase